MAWITRMKRLASTLMAIALVVGLASPALAHPGEHAAAVAHGESTLELRAGPDNKSLDRLYRAYFRRDPDRDGLDYWRAQLAEGISLAQISQQFAASSEFQTTYGQLDNRGFVDLIYRNVMGREADPAGQRHWARVLDEGRVSRGGVMIGFSDSVEFKQLTGLVDDASPRPDTSADTADPQRARVHGPKGIWAQSNSDLWMARQPHDRGAPVRWDPCQPIRVAVRSESRPAGASDAVRAALANLRAVTGLDLRLVDKSHEAEVEVRWAVPSSGALGTGGARYTWIGDGVARYVKGTVTIDPSVAAPLLLPVLIHEFGHVIGMSHSSNPASIMYHHLTVGPGIEPQDWTAEDLVVLRGLGAEVGCID